MNPYDPFIYVADLPFGLAGFLLLVVGALVWTFYSEPKKTFLFTGSILFCAAVFCTLGLIFMGLFLKSFLPDKQTVNYWFAAVLISSVIWWDFIKTFRRTRLGD